MVITSHPVPVLAQTLSCYGASMPSPHKEELVIYDKLPVALLSALATEREGTTNAVIAHYLVTHADQLHDASVKGVAAACNVGVGSVSRFCRDTGFSGFEELRSVLEAASHSFERAPGEGTFDARAQEHAGLVGDGLQRVANTIDQRALELLVDDLVSHERVFTCGMLKAQAAAVDLQVDLLMQGKYVETSVSYADQLAHIAKAGRDELVVLFSYTGSYFDARDLSDALARIDRPRIWVVAGARHPQPTFVYGCLAFDSDWSQLTHPFQLEMAAALISQEYARRGV